MRVCLLFIVLSQSFFSYCQKIENVTASFSDDKITVTYDLTGGNPKRLYKVELLSSHNNFNYPLLRVTGDVGDKVSVGQGKKIVWDVNNEMSKYQGDISFKVKGAMTAMDFEFKNPVSGTGIRRGKTTVLKWEGGLPNQMVKIEMFQGGYKVADIMERKNTEEFTWAVPKDLKKANNYSLKITAGEKSATSDQFSIKSKMPLLLKLSPIVLGAALIPVLGGGGGGGNAPPGSSKLPGAPDPN